MANISDPPEITSYLNYFPHKKLTEIRIRNINWASFLQMQRISQDDYLTLNMFDRSRELGFEQNPERIIKTILTVLPQLLDDYATEYILLFVDDVLKVRNTAMVDLFHNVCKKNEQCVWGPFLGQLRKTDGLTVTLAAEVLTKLACWGSLRMNDKDLQFFLHFLLELLPNPNPLFKVYKQVQVHCLQTMIRVEQYRLMFLKMNGINAIQKQLPQCVPQIQYQLIFCYWVLSFTPSNILKLYSQSIIPLLVQILGACNKEKVQRIVLATLNNMIEKNDNPNLQVKMTSEMIESELLERLDNITNHYMYDEEAKENVESLSALLNKAHNEMCTFDKYAIEVRSGRLQWSPVHKSDSFWLENSHRLNERNYELLRCLVQLLENSKDPNVLTIALYDIGQYMRRYPDGKQALENLSGKEPILSQLLHKEESVRAQAVLTSAILLRFN